LTELSRPRLTTRRTDVDEVITEEVSEMDGRGSSIEI
jgi:hypothetical protein